MANYYIVKMNGLFKQYFSSNDGGESIKFSPSLRNAKPFSSVDEAVFAMKENELTECVIINQMGDIQSI